MKDWPEQVHFHIPFSELTPSAGLFKMFSKASPLQIFESQYFYFNYITRYNKLQKCYLLVIASAGCFIFLKQC